MKIAKKIIACALLLSMALALLTGCGFNCKGTWTGEGSDGTQYALMLNGDKTFEYKKLVDGNWETFTFGTYSSGTNVKVHMKTVCLETVDRGQMDFYYDDDTGALCFTTLKLYKAD